MTKQDLASERKNQIINATIECISRYGYNNFSMQDVARIADVSKGIIHYYFLNKEDLMMAVLERVAGDIEGLLSTLSSEQAQDPAERVRAIIRRLFDVVKKEREYYCINIDFWTQINQKEKVRQTVARHYSKFRTALAGLIQQGIDTGTFRSVNPMESASMIIAMVDGLSLQWLFDESTFLYEDLVQRCEDLLIQSLKK